METNVESYKLLCTTCLCFGRTLQPLREEKLNQCYLDIIKEIPLYNTPIQSPSVCLECSASLRKVVSFREQVQDSYRILQAYTNETLTEFLLTDVSRPPKLRVQCLETVDIQPTDVNSETGGDKHVLKNELKNEFCDIKVQIDRSFKERSDSVRDEESADNNHFVCVKDELKDENREDETELRDSLSDCPLSDHENASQLDEQLHCRMEKELQSFMTEMKKEKVKVKRKKKKRKNENDKTSTETKQDTSKILTIELSYEEMLAEREKDSNKESYTNAEFKCESCLIGFNYKTSYSSHMAAKHSPSTGSYSCLICKTLFSTIESLQVHHKRHLRRYQCGLCGKRTMDMKVMEQHYYSTHDISLKQYECPVCPHVSNSIDLHRYHKDTHKARLQCPSCDKSFIHRAGLLNHRLAVHELRNSFPCALCDKVFRWRTSLKRHAEKHDAHTQERATSSIRCEACKISFASECSYRRHMKNSLKHVSQDQLRYVCDDCNKRFADKTKLRDHIEEKHLHKTYQCHICLKPSKNRVGLDQHIRNVHKGRPNNKMCHHCGKGFPTKVQLESHIRTHTGERPFICEFCPTMFSQQSNLYKHNRQVHLNMKSKRYPAGKKRREDPSPAYQLLKKRDGVPTMEVPAMTVFTHYDRYCPV
ncbi:PR domain zinc finger protein 5-like [Plodia interpunctella]|uniref:PR domain zinc finger protein 5-like n=1 Tax=Plodia interpunctella TaxID=58824 RepID=UPI002367A591|nr:PR domain zinc finger protein 5-like [Plodia interpunctella]